MFNTIHCIYIIFSQLQKGNNSHTYFLTTVRQKPYKESRAEPHMDILWKTKRASSSVLLLYTVRDFLSNYIYTNKWKD